MSRNCEAHVSLWCLQMHTFSYAAQMQPTTERYRRLYGERYPPMQTLFCVKEHNGGKLDSHKWFFDAFCARMDPQYVVVRSPARQVHWALNSHALFVHACSSWMLAHGRQPSQSVA